MSAELVIVIGEPYREEDVEEIAKRLLLGISTVLKSAPELDSDLQSLLQPGSSPLLVEDGLELKGKGRVRLLLGNRLSSVVENLFECLCGRESPRKYILHAGCVAEGSGNWLLRDGVFSSEKLAALLHRSGVAESGAHLSLLCLEEGAWKAENVKKLSPCLEVVPVCADANEHAVGRMLYEFAKKLLVNILLDPAVQLKPSEAVGKIRFPRPAVYVFPGGEGTSALFGMNSFSFLVESGCGRVSGAWNLIRHLEGVDLLLLPHFSPETVTPIASYLARSCDFQAQVFPHVGCVFANVPPPASNGTRPLVVSAWNAVESISRSMSRLSLKPRPLSTNGKKPADKVEPVLLYHKIGEGRLDMYVLNPGKESVTALGEEWKKKNSKIFSGEASLNASCSAAVLLVWIPESSTQSPVRILFPGQCPLPRLWSSLERLKEAPFLKTPFKSGPNTVTKPVTTPAQAYTPDLLSVQLSESSRGHSQASHLESPVSPNPPEHVASTPQHISEHPQFSTPHQESKLEQPLPSAPQKPPEPVVLQPTEQPKEVALTDQGFGSPLLDPLSESFPQQELPKDVHFESPVSPNLPEYKAPPPPHVPKPLQSTPNEESKFEQPLPGPPQKHPEQVVNEPTEFPKEVVLAEPGFGSPMLDPLPERFSQQNLPKDMDVSAVEPPLEVLALNPFQDIPQQPFELPRELQPAAVVQEADNSWLAEELREPTSMEEPRPVEADQRRSASPVKKEPEIHLQELPNPAEEHVPAAPQDPSAHQATVHVSQDQPHVFGKPFPEPTLSDAEMAAKLKNLEPLETHDYDNPDFLCGASDVPLQQHLSPVGSDDLFGVEPQHSQPLPPPEGLAPFPDFTQPPPHPAQPELPHPHHDSQQPDPVQVGALHGHDAQQPPSVEELKETYGPPLGLPTPPTSKPGSTKPPSDKKPASAKRPTPAKPDDGNKPTASSRTRPEPPKPSETRARPAGPSKAAPSSKPPTTKPAVPKATNRPAAATRPTSKPISSLTKSKDAPASKAPTKARVSPAAATPSSTAKPRPSSAKPSSASKKATIAPLFMDLVFIPHDADEEFFRTIRARNYVLGGTEPGAGLLAGFLAGKKSWGKPELEVDLIPTYDSTSLHLWMALQRDDLCSQSITVTPSAARCTVSLERDLGTCPAYRLEL